MPDIFHTYPINTSVSKLFATLTTPAGLDAWWTQTSSGSPIPGTTYELFFGEGYDWRAVVTEVRTDAVFELELTEADADWRGTRLRFVLTAFDGGTQLEFSHTGWPENNDHFRISSFCWAMYLRVLKRWLEFGEEVAYSDRLSV